jgi:hypothetical protein
MVADTLIMKIVNVTNNKNITNTKSLFLFIGINKRIEIESV